MDYMRGFCYPDETNLMLRSKPSKLRYLPEGGYWSRYNHRYDPLANSCPVAGPSAKSKTPVLHRPQLNIPDKENSPPPAGGTHISRLYPEILAQIFAYLDLPDKGRVAQVCVQWRDASYDNKSVWRGATAKLHLKRGNQTALFESLTRRGIKRVQILSARRSLRDITAGIRNLTSLNLSGCFNLKDEAICSAFHIPIPTLTELDLSSCKQITDRSVAHCMQLLENLQTVELGGCCLLTDHSLFAISVCCRNLVSLNLRSCWQVTDKGISYLAGQQRLPAISVAVASSTAVPSSNCRIKPIPLDLRCKLAKAITASESSAVVTLRHLRLQDCQHITDLALKHVAFGLPNLESVNLSFCFGVTDTGLRYLAQMSSLRHLNVSSCDNVSDSGIGYMAGATAFKQGGDASSCLLRLRTLDASFCDKIGDQSLRFISQACATSGQPSRLKTLNLAACRVSDEGVVRLCEACPNLEHLHLGQCHRITDASFSAIVKSLTKLRIIDLYGCPNVSFSEAMFKHILHKLPPSCTLNLGLNISISRVARG